MRLVFIWFVWRFLNLNTGLKFTVIHLSQQPERTVVVPSGKLGFRVTGSAQAGLGAEY